MPNLQDIREPIKHSFDAFEKVYASYTGSTVAYVDYCLSKLGADNGKRVRPLLLLLSAGLFGKPSEKAVKLAAAMEILHITSLVHDDIVDESNVRHGRRTLNALEGNKLAVLTGDYLFSQVLRLCSETGDIAVVDDIAHLAQNMGEGELIQQYVTNKRIADEKDYFTVIEKKTAVFMSHCCRIGAYCAGADSQSQSALAQFGLSIGMAFQIKDDVLDYIGTETGKPLGNDLREHKTTLPLLYLLRNSANTEAVKNRLSNDILSDDDVDFIVAEVLKSGGIEYSLRKIEEYAKEAKKHLETLPDNACRHSLQRLSEFIVNRNY